MERAGFRRGLVLGLMALVLGAVLFVWRQGSRVISSPEESRFEMTREETVRGISEMGLTFLRGATGYAIDKDEAGGLYRLEVTEFGPPEPGSETGEWPGGAARRSISLGAGAVTSLELLYGWDESEGREELACRIRDGRTGVILDPKGDVSRPRPNLLYVSFYPMALHPLDARIEFWRPPATELWIHELPALTGMPAGNREVVDLFDLEVPFVRAEPHDLQRLVAGWAQLRYEPDFVMVPQQMEAADYRGCSVGELWDEYRSHDPVGGIYVDSRRFLIRRRIPWSVRLREEFRKRFP